MVTPIIIMELLSQNDLSIKPPMSDIIKTQIEKMTMEIKNLTNMLEKGTIIMIDQL